jgi:hypothetical protein
MLIGGYLYLVDDFRRGLVCCVVCPVEGRKTLDSRLRGNDGFGGSPG